MSDFAEDTNADPFGMGAAPEGMTDFGDAPADPVVADATDAPVGFDELQEEPAAEEPVAVEDVAPVVEADPFQAAEPVESNALTEFMARWEAELETKRQAEVQQKEEAKAKAQEDLAAFAQEKVVVKEAKQSANRQEEQVFQEQLLADLESANPWERVVNLVDLQTDSSDAILDVSRMRSIFIQLKNEPLAATRGEA